jgi:GNAT superfamily N-acetyltransferase
MIKNNLPDVINDGSLSDNYYFRDFKPGEETSWAVIETSAGEFPDIKAAQDRFSNEFGSCRDEFYKRTILLCAGECVIGTATAWYDKQFADGAYGRLHWVALLPEYQGKGLAKALVGGALQRMARYHTKAYCKTQTTSYKAIKVYLDFGFEPHLASPEHIIAWRTLAELLNHPKLKPYR